MRRAFFILCSILSAATVHAQVEVSKPWARATIDGQTTAGVYMSLRAREELKLVKVSSPLAQSAELHSTVKDGNTARMRAVPDFLLKNDEPFVLKPGGYHMMLIGLKHALKTGEVVPLTLTFARADGTLLSQELKADVLEKHVILKEVLH